MYHKEVSRGDIYWFYLTQEMIHWGHSNITDYWPTETLTAWVTDRKTDRPTDLLTD